VTGNGVPPAPPGVLRRVETSEAAALADLAATFEDLQMVLRCCERLMSELTTAPGGPDDVAVEAIWTTALLSYARCFSVEGSGAGLTEDDVRATHPQGDVMSWHEVLLQLRDHYADPTANPREQFSVGVAQDPSGAADGIAITSARQPLVDELTVRQTGAIAFALSSLVDGRIAAQQETVLGELKRMPRAALDKLVQLDIAHPADGQ
jgi:hypothetical protein